MFFYLAKIFWFFIQPSGLLLVLAVLATALLWHGRERASRWLMIAVTALVLVGGLLPMSNWLMLPLEQRFLRATLEGKKVSGIIVLGGAEEARVWRGRKVHALNEAAERFTEGVALARRFPSAKVVFTGAAVESLLTFNDAADAAREVLADLGISEPRVVFETKARDTWENAANLEGQLRPAPEQAWLLVTSAWHMPRAIGAFRAAGFVVEPWPVDYRTAGPLDAIRLFDAPADGLKRLDTAVREWIGLLSYRITGRSDALFPAPR